MRSVIETLLNVIFTLISIVSVNYLNVEKEVVMTMKTITKELIHEKRFEIALGVYVVLMLLCSVSIIALNIGS